MKIYHNEIDPRCCEVLERRFPDSVVDRRSIEDVQSQDLEAYRQCHFFAGIGGFSEAFRRAGVGADRNVWTGGFPCQDLSVAGKRAGLAGGRSGLYFHFQRLIAQSRPDLVILENVPGLLSSNKGKDFAIVVGGLTGIIPAVPAGGWGSAGFFRGRVYSVAYRIFDAQYFGVAQRRRRVFIVASLAARGRSVGAAALQDGQGLSGLAAEILFEREGMYGDPPARGEAGQGTSADAGERAETGWDYQRFRIHDARGIAPTMSQADGKGGQRTPIIAFAQNTRDEVRQVNGDGQIVGALGAEPGMKQQNYVAFGGGNTSGPIDIATARNVKGDTRSDFDTETFVAFNPQSGGDMRMGVGDKPTALQANQKSAFAFTERTRKDGRNLETQEELAYALTNPGSGGRTHSRQIAESYGLRRGVRRLTPVECERLQGFEDDWTNDQSDSARYRQLGNAVAIPNVEWLARRIEALYR